MTSINKQDFYGLLRQHGWTPDRVEGTKQIFQHKDGRRYRAPLLTREFDTGIAKDILEGMRIVQPNGQKNASDVITAARAGATKLKRGGNKVALGGAAVGTFGARLFEARVKAGIGQAVLAKEVGGNQTQISTWERGIVTPFAPDGHISFKSSVPIIARIAQRFGFMDILEKTGPAPALTPKQAKEAAAGAPKPVEIPEPIVALKDEPQSELAVELAKLRERHPDERDFARLLKASDIMQWIIDMETRVRNAELAVAKYERADIGALRRKAAAVDTIKAKMAELAKQMAELEA